LNRRFITHNINNFSTWTASSNTSPLPITLLNFKAFLREQQVELKWNTASEINNDFFTIERSSNAVDFTPIGRIDGAGTSGLTNEYTFYDPAPLRGISYYRLQQSDFDGTIESLRIVSVYFPDENLREKVTLDIWPNPNRGVFSVQLNHNEALPYRIFDLQGRIVAEGVAEPGIARQMHLEGKVRSIYYMILYSDFFAYHHDALYLQQ
jgi:hypothetical protein